MLDTSGFEVPLNTQNFFVRRGQVLSATLDALARWRALERTNPVATMQAGKIRLHPDALAQATRFVSTIFGSDVFEEIEFRDAQDLLQQAIDPQAGLPVHRAPREWVKSLRWAPRALFDTINLPPLIVRVPGDGQRREVSEDIALALAMGAPGNMTRRYAPTQLHWSVPTQGMGPWHGLEFTLETLPGAGLAHFLSELPETVRNEVGPSVVAGLARPTRLTLEIAGDKFAEWTPRWNFNPQTRRVVSAGQDGAWPVHEKSQGTLRGSTVVHAATAGAERLEVDLPGSLGTFCSYRSTPYSRGLTATQVYWASDVVLKCAKPNIADETFAHGFTDPQSGKRLLVGYSVSTEAVQLTADSHLLDAFVQRQMKALSGTADERMLRGRFFRYLLESKALGLGLSTFEAARLSELLQSAARDPELRAELQRLRQFWSDERLASVLRNAHHRFLTQHPLLSIRRIERLSESIVRTSFKTALLSALTEAGQTDSFARYLRSLVLHGLAIRLHQQVVLLGRGEERRVLSHAKLPIQFGDSAHDTITVFENGGGGDGTIRTFIEFIGDLAVEWPTGGLWECPNAAEDDVIERVTAAEQHHDRWLRMDPRDTRTTELIAEDLALGSGLLRTALDAALRVLFGREHAGDQSFELLQLQKEIRGIRMALEQRLERRASTWELVSSAVQRASMADQGVPQLRRLRDAYASLEDAHLEEGLSADARLADQVYRLSGTLCVDGCQACLHTSGTLLPGSLVESTTSRSVLERFARFALSV